MNKELILQELKQIIVNIQDNEALAIRISTIFEGQLELPVLNDKLYDLINYVDMPSAVKDSLSALKVKIEDLMNLEALVLAKEENIIKEEANLEKNKEELSEQSIVADIKMSGKDVLDERILVTERIDDLDNKLSNIENENKEIETFISQIKNEDIAQTKYFSDLSLDRLKDFIVFFESNKEHENKFQMSIGRDLDSLDRRSIMMHYTSSLGEIQKDNVFVYVDYKDGALFDQDILPSVVGLYSDNNKTKTESIHRGAVDGISSYINESVTGNKLVLFNMTNEAINMNKELINKNRLVKTNQMVKKPFITKPTNYLTGFVDALLLAFLTGLFAGIIMAISYVIIF